MVKRLMIADIRYSPDAEVVTPQSPGFSLKSIQINTIPGVWSFVEICRY
jgi:hypothetical protein